MARDANANSSVRKMDMQERALKTKQTILKHLEVENCKIKDELRLARHLLGSAEVHLLCRCFVHLFCGGIILSASLLHRVTFHSARFGLKIMPTTQKSLLWTAAPTQMKTVDRRPLLHTLQVGTHNSN